MSDYMYMYAQYAHQQYRERRLLRRGGDAKVPELGAKGGTLDMALSNTCIHFRGWVEL